MSVFLYGQMDVTYRRWYTKYTKSTHRHQAKNNMYMLSFVYVLPAKFQRPCVPLRFQPLCNWPLNCSIMTWIFRCKSSVSMNQG